jgi:hypothetical protein
MMPLRRIVVATFDFVLAITLVVGSAYALTYNFLSDRDFTCVQSSNGDCSRRSEKREKFCGEYLHEWV